MAIYWNISLIHENNATRLMKYNLNKIEKINRLYSYVQWVRSETSLARLLYFLSIIYYFVITLDIHFNSSIIIITKLIYKM